MDDANFAEHSTSTIAALADLERTARELTQQRAEKKPRQREDIVMSSWLAEWWYKHVTRKDKPH